MKIANMLQPEKICRFLLNENLIEVQLFIGISVVAFAHFFRTYIYEDIHFLNFLIVLTILDALAGTYVALKITQTFTLKEFFSRTGEKLFVYGLLLIVFHVLTSFEIKNDHLHPLYYSDYVGHTIIVGAEATSIMVHICTIKPKLLNFLPTKIKVAIIKEINKKKHK